MTARPPVAFIPCPSYGAPVEHAVGSLLESLGGSGVFWKKGQRVLIKPNLLTDRRPDEATTTHPDVVRALVRRIRADGAFPSLGDSPASSTRLARVLETTGMRQVAEEEGAQLVNLEEAGSVRIEDDGCVFTVARPVLEADVVISVPKFKTHVLTILTAAVKNLYGTVPGFQKTQLHREHPDLPGFSRLLHAIARHVPVALHVVDGIVGMEGNGPSGGDPRTFGFLAACTHPYELDYFLCHLTGIRPGTVPYLVPPPPGVIPTARLLDHVVVGTPERTGDVPRCRPPSTLPGRLIPRRLVRLLAPLFWIRPQITSDLCIRCGRCVNACPVGALEQPGREHAPRLDGTRCIGCCCCHEVCPAKAITMRQSPFLTLARRGRQL